MMKSSGLQKDKKLENNIIKDVKNLFRLKNKQMKLQLKMYENFFRLKKWLRLKMQNLF